MTLRAGILAAGVGIVVTSMSALAQQPAPPSFAPPTLTEKGVRSMAAACATCHGTDGRAPAGSAVSGLAGRPSTDFVAVMKMFKEGRRPATVMHQIAKGYNDAEIAALAEFYSKQSR